MRIAHVVWGMKTGGVETMLVNIINEQVRYEDVNLFIINDFVENSIIDKISPKCKIYWLKRKPGSKNILKILKLNLWIWKYHPNIIHVHSYQVSKLIYGRWNIVRTIHNTGNIPEEYPKMKALYAISDAVKDVTIKQGFSNVKCIYNGILVNDIKKRIVSKPCNNKYKIVQVSRLDISQKGQDILLNAVDILLHTYNISNFSLHFIGVGASEEMLKEMVEHKELKGYVFFEGLKSQDYIYSHLCDYDLFIQPSRYEGFGITVAEALAAKVPILVSDIEGPMEIIGNGEFGMYFKSESVEDLAEKLRVILRGGYDYDLVEKAYQHVCDEYDVKNTAKEYIEAYKQVLKPQKEISCKQYPRS